MSPTSMRIVVVLPAPFGPRNPKTSPGKSSNEMPSTIVFLPITLRRSRATSDGASLLNPICDWRLVILCYVSRAMRRILLWYVPVSIALLAAAIFAAGFYSFVRGNIGEAVTPASSHINAETPRNEIVTLVIGDSLARGTGDQSGLGIGGRLVDELKKSRANVKPAVNIAVNGARTPDVAKLLDSRNVQTLIAQSNVIVVSIGGNDLWGSTDWRAVA